MSFFLNANTNGRCPIARVYSVFFFYGTRSRYSVYFFSFFFFYGTRPRVDGVSLFFMELGLLGLLGEGSASTEERFEKIFSIGGD